jgi:tRNA A-37 threonylcarbamoyl transferase component Bud32
MTSNTPVSSIRFFSGHWLIFARAIWILLCIISIAFLIIALTSIYTGWMGQGQSCRVPMPDFSMQGTGKTDCETKRQAFQQLGLPRWFPASFFTTGAGLQVVSWILVGTLIFLRSSHKPWEYFFALMLVVTGTFNLDDNLRITGFASLPTLIPLLRIISYFGAILLTIIYFFPDGHLAHRSLKWMIGIWIILVLLSGFFPKSTFLNYNLWPSPLPAIVPIGFALSYIFSFAYRYRNVTTPIQRQQIKWIVTGGIIFGLVFITGFLLIYIFPSAFEANTPQVIVWLIYLPVYYIARMFLAGTILFSIMRYRLWDIDFIINRSLVYGTLSLLLAVIFGGSLWVIHNLFQDFAGEPLLAVAISAAIFGALFQPSRRNLQRFVDQRFYNINIDYKKTVPPLPRGSATQVLSTTHFSVYQNLELIGRGGMADVYKSTHPELQKPVAIKILPAHLSNEAEFRKRFTREAQVISKLEHPNIIRMYDSGEHGGSHYMVMEYLAGKDLNEFIKENGKLALSQVVLLVRQIAAALDYAHAQGVIHRDIKPSNVLLDLSTNGNLRAILTDFGIAKILNAQTAMTQTGDVIGSFDYIAPEQIEDSSKLDGKADIYALGVMAFQMLTGELPFKHERTGALLIAHMTQPPPDPCKIEPDLSEQTCKAIQRAMAKKPEDRFFTATEFAAALHPAA